MTETFNKIRSNVIDTLTKKLPTYLTYHSVEHTKYVLKMAEYLAWRAGVSDHEVFLIKVAALYHDIGFIEGRENHEERGCKIARKDLPEYQISEEDIDTICGMIMATKIPQNPKNLLEEILADADLEYLSTQNFDPVSDMLFNEIRHYRPDFTLDEWNDVQIDFLTTHSYHTEFCIKYKENFKQQHLMKLRGQTFHPIGQN